VVWYVMKNRLAIIVLCLFLAGTIFFLQREFERQGLDFHAQHGYVIPDARAIKTMALGFDNLLSDIFAIQAINSLYVTNQSDPEYWKETVEALKGILKNPLYHTHADAIDVFSFSRYAYISVYLDPYDVERIELFTLLMSWAFNFGDGSIAILEYAAHENKIDWEIPYHLALNHLVYRGDKERAVHWLKEASLRPGALPVVDEFLLDLASEGSDKDNVLAALRGLKQIVKDEKLRQSIEENIKQVEQGKIIKNVDWKDVNEKLKKVKKGDGSCHGHHHHHHEGHHSH